MKQDIGRSAVTIDQSKYFEYFINSTKSAIQ